MESPSPLPHDAPATPAESSAAPSPVELAIARLREVQAAGRHAETLEAALTLAARYPENRDALILAARALRHLGRIDEALAMLDRLAEHHPGFSRLYEERGLCHVARKQAAPAIDALLRAVTINGALVMSWRMLHGLYRLTGDEDNAGHAATHLAALQALPPVIVTASALFADGDLASAEPMVRAYLIEQGNHPEAMRLLARIGMAHEVLDDAETLFEALLELAPDHHRARYEYADCLIRRRKPAAARDELGRLLALDPGNLDYRVLMGTALVSLGEHDKAIALYRAMEPQIPATEPLASDLQLWLGHALKTVGDLPSAIAAYRRAAALRPDFGDAYWSLANLKTYRFEDAEIAAMAHNEAAADTALADRYHLCFALGKAHEDRGDSARAWTYYERGNALKRSESLYRADIIETNTRLQKQVCTRAFFAAREGWGDPRPDPIFVLGLPRAGSTLIEQILASHSQVEGTQELADIQSIVLDLQGREMNFDHPRYPEILGQMPRDAFAALGAKYLADTRIYRSGKPFFIDKMPNNFRHIGIIHLMLPNAKIIDARREPMACCFSNLKQLFAQGQEFTYSIDDIARYYQTYVDLMAHWDTALPGRVLRVHHEDVVDDLETSVRRILDYCGLPFEPGCIEFHKNRRSVRTPSAEQVRQPIFRDGLDQWKKFEAWLDPLQERLGPMLTAYRD